MSDRYQLNIQFFGHVSLIVDCSTSAGGVFRSKMAMAVNCVGVGQSKMNRWYLLNLDSCLIQGTKIIGKSPREFVGTQNHLRIVESPPDVIQRKNQP